jgi:N-acetylglucosaminyldiphosphoundecaprenol N-acetyl-beta-D-mannosaminyltransferase
LAKITIEDAIDLVDEWVDNGTGVHTVSFAASHLLVEAHRDPALSGMLRGMDMVCPDGRPLSWIGRFRFGGHIAQVAGPDFMPQFIEQSVARGYRHFIYGGAAGVAEKAAQNLDRRYPGVQIVGSYTPPFRPLTAPETDELCELINRSGAQLVWVCLGCPKQEKWIVEVHDRLDAKVLLAVGYALELVAGVSVRAPQCMRVSGLEWLYRLVHEPRRLWKRYLTSNFWFLVWIAQEIASRQLQDRKRGRPAVKPFSARWWSTSHKEP